MLTIINYIGRLVGAVEYFQFFLFSSSAVKLI
jgi:hypothetical protein